MPVTVTQPRNLALKVVEGMKNDTLLPLEGKEVTAREDHVAFEEALMGFQFPLLNVFIHLGVPVRHGIP